MVRRKRLLTRCSFGSTSYILGIYMRDLSTQEMELIAGGAGPDSATWYDKAFDWLDSIFDFGSLWGGFVGVGSDIGSSGIDAGRDAAGTIDDYDDHIGDLIDQAETGG
jgi:hypothetical protein